MGYKTLFEQIKTVCAWNSLTYKLFTYGARYVNIRSMTLFPALKCVWRNHSKQGVRIHSNSLLRALTLSYTIHDFICTYMSTLFADQVTNRYIHV